MSWRSRLIAWLTRHEHDAAWKPTGLKFLSGRDYLEDKAVAGSKRSRLRTASGRLYKSRKTARLVARRAAVVPFRKKAAK